MNKRLADVTHRRHKLLEKIDAQRVNLSELSLSWKTPMTLIDGGLKVVHFARNHRALTAGGLAALLAFRRKGVVGLALEGWRLLYLYPSILSLGLRFLFPSTRPSDEVDNSYEHTTKAYH